MGELFWWWLAAEVMGIAVLPVSAVLFAHLPDRGWALTRPLGVLVLGWLVWFPLSLVSTLPYSRGWIAGTLLVLALANLAILRQAEIRTALWRLVRQQRGYLLAGEGVFAGSLALMGWVRSFTPAVVDQEKLMDVAFLSAIWRAPHLPPPDPWLAGEPINYYYFGHFLMATIAKLLATPPSVAFNTSVALTFALVASAVFAVAANVVAARPANQGRPLAAAVPFGLASVALVLVLGNLDGALVWWHQATTLVANAPAVLGNPWAWWTHPALWTQYDWWSPSRVIDPSNTINEFPAFSFVLADLHAHVLALPFAGLALGVALNLLLASDAGLRAFGARWVGMLALGLSGLTLGGLYAINGWDLPTYLGFALLALGVQQWIQHGRRWSTLFLLDTLTAGIMLITLAVLLYLPFYRGFVSPAQGVGLVPAGARSLLGEELAIFGLPLFLVGSLLIVRLAEGLLPWPEPGEPASRAQLAERAAPVFLVAATLLLLAVWTALAPGARGWTLLWSIVLLAGCVVVVLLRLVPTVATHGEQEAPDRPEIFIWCLAGTAFALVAGGEMFYLRDVFDGGSYFRMNTIFKLYYQAWLLLGVASGPALAALLPRARARLARLLAPSPAIEAAQSAPGGLATASLGRSARSAPIVLALAAVRESVRARTAGWSGWRAAAAGPEQPVRALAADRVPGVADDDERELMRPFGRRESVATLLRRLPAGGTLLWGAALLALLGAAAVYPVQAVAARTANLTLPRSLNGTAYMASDPLNQGDAAAIAWLNDPAHVADDPTIVEASGGEYSHYDRISAFTGLPTILGWSGHEYQWRVNWLGAGANANELNQRLADVKQIYTSNDPQVVRALLARYHVRYVYVGAAERQMYPGVDLKRFASFLKVAYRSATVTIYQVS